MTERGERTREHLLDVAERLYGERGVKGASLREIRLAAGARNTAAIQFHFGNRDGLLQALIDRHMPRVGALQQELYDRLSASGAEQDTRALVEVLIRPVADYMLLGESERSWVKIMAYLAALPDLHLREMVFVTPEAGLKAGTALFAKLETTLPAEVARERMVLLAQTSVQVCADYARVLDDPDRSRRHLPVDLFVENLIDVTTGAFLAPVSAATSTALARA